MGLVIKSLYFVFLLLKFCIVASNGLLISFCALGMMVYVLSQNFMKTLSVVC